MKYQCKTCGENFEEDINCVVHHIDAKHENFELIGSDVSIVIKTPENKKS